MVVDFYSGFNEVKQLQERSCSFNLITFFKELFYKYGVPGTLVTNKGQQFTSHIITGQTTNWNFMTKLSFRQSRKSSRTRKILGKVPLDQMNAPSESLRTTPGNKTFVPSISASLKYQCYILFRHHSV